MGNPLILYGLADLANPSFEDAGTPTGWDITASVAGINTVDAAVYQFPGDGIPSVKSLKQNVSGGTAGNKAVARQRIAIADLPSFVLEGVVEVAAIASLKVARTVGGQNAILRIRQYDATGTATPGTGALVAAPAERRFQCAGPEWFLRVTAQRIHASAAYVDLELVYDIALGAYDATADIWWDRAFLGVLVDMPKGFRSFDIDIDSGFNTNEGNGVAEIVRTAKARTSIDIEIRNLPENADHLAAFSRWLASEDVGFLALWADRDKLTNAERHFAMMYQDPSMSIEYPPGFPRRHYTLNLIAPSETP